MKLTKCFCSCRRDGGSALVMVLWVVALIVFLSGDYLEHNRGKATLAENAWQSLRQREAVFSLLNLFASDDWPIPRQEKKHGAWISMSPCGVELWVKMDNESDRVNINTGAENDIKEKMRQILGEGRADESDEITNAVLDWRDADDLVRSNGAEERYYKSKGLEYKPANGRFKVLTELLLVKGVSSDLFWGDPISHLLNQTEQPIPESLAETFTIYGDHSRRVSILIPDKQKGYTIIFVFLEKRAGTWEVIQVYRNMRTIPGDEDIFSQRESNVELS